MPDGPTTPDAPPRPRRARLLLAIALTALIGAMPVLGAVIAEAWTGESIDRDMLIGASVLAACGGAFAWAGLLAIRIVRASAARQSAAALAAPTHIHEPDLIRALLAGRDLPCRRCGYNLRGLSAGACPECQEPIELWLGGTATLRPLVWITRLGVVALVCHAIASGVVLYGVIGFLDLMDPGFADRLVIILIYIGGPVVCIGGLLTVVGLGLLHGRANLTATHDVLRWRILRTVVITFLIITLFHLAGLAWNYVFA